MDISRAEQRVLHLLARGGRIERVKDDDLKTVLELTCYTRDGWAYPGFDEALFKRLKRRRAIASKAGGPYLITRKGLLLVRAQSDNR